MKRIFCLENTFIKFIGASLCMLLLWPAHPSTNTSGVCKTFYKQLWQELMALHHIGGLLLSTSEQWFARAVMKMEYCKMTFPLYPLSLAFLLACSFEGSPKL